MKISIGRRTEEICGKRTESFELQAEQTSYKTELVTYITPLCYKLKNKTKHVFSPKLQFKKWFVLLDLRCVAFSFLFWRFSRSSLDEFYAWKIFLCTFRLTLTLLFFSSLSFLQVRLSTSPATFLSTVLGPLPKPQW